MADRKSFLLRIDPRVLERVQRWANDDLRSLNAQIEYVLREALRRAGRMPEVRGQRSEVGAEGSNGPNGPNDPSIR